MRKFITLFIGLLLVSGLTFGVFGAGNVEAEWTIDSCHVTLDLSSNSVDLSTEDGDYLKNEGAHSVTVTSNCGWEVSVKADGAVGYTGSFDDPNKPVSDFEFRVSPNGRGKGIGGYTALSDTEKTVENGHSGTGQGGNSFDMDYRVDVTDDVPGTYSATLVYTVTSSEHGSGSSW